MKWLTAQTPIWMVGFFLALGFTWFARGGFVQSVVATVAIILLLGPAIVAAVILGSWRRKHKGGGLRWAHRAVSCLSFFLFFLMLCLPLGIILRVVDINRAMVYCSSLMDQLEIHYRRTGQYPEMVDIDRSQLPRNVRGKTAYYRLNSGGYEFRITIPGTWPDKGYVVYHSIDDEWKETGRHGKMKARQ